jgi:hypothetical protein
VGIGESPLRQQRAPGAYPLLASRGSHNSIAAIIIFLSMPVAVKGWPRNMLDWLTWPADQLLRIGGVVAGWFFSRDATSFTVVQMMFATLVLAAFVTLIVCWQSLVEYWRSFWKPR